MQNLTFGSNITCWSSADNHQRQAPSNDSKDDRKSISPPVSANSSRPRGPYSTDNATEEAVHVRVLPHPAAVTSAGSNRAAKSLQRTPSEKSMKSSPRSPHPEPTGDKLPPIRSGSAKRAVDDLVLARRNVVLSLVDMDSLSDLVDDAMTARSDNAPPRTARTNQRI